MQIFSFLRMQQLSLSAVFLTCFLQTAVSQVFTVSTAVTPNHKSCYSGSLTCSYVATITPPIRSWVYGTDYTYNLNNTTFKLRTAASGAGGAELLINGGGTIAGSTITGSFDLSTALLAPDVYTIYTSITVVTGSTSQVVQTTSTFVIGYQASWASLLDMQALPNSYSAKRTSTTGGVTTARGISANLLGTSASGWMDLGAQFGGTTGTVTFVIGKTTSAITDPTTQAVRLVFTRTGSATGSVAIVTTGSTFTVPGMNFDGRIVVRRTVNSVQFYNSATGILISGAPTFTISSEMNVGVFAANLNDGAASILTSFPCVFDNQFYYLKDEVEQTMALVGAAETKLRFKYEEAYFDGTGNLNYKIICLTDDVVPTTVTVTKPAHTNWIEIPLGSGGVAFTAGNTYLLEVTDAKGRKQYLKYKKM